mmetsp:Transcript_24186/g.46336  ORF Transcript_24186/g.46336 Transcript_24186/m.46336 type:complete len:581 (+) Transcript_24186:428-2170(+)|eukprot:CAMPEP_0201675796 /NCGR_PEP_ID=MMETSP0494-20130426/40379_1 /ASSEMBLY_ACC=CAM_ASM_000839 /TAXON_ID=420259 /ORGANISM="Thalassiosira gravida, Strain GMp14c1" /LENGTH=580 /DNA_ID=CAMNT_0048158341 /DNA_START=404 /DNA_END=2146 /DNA_ORIENTATION=-
MSHDLCELGIVGLTTLGQSLAAHHSSNKTRVCVADEDPTFVPQVIGEYMSQMEAGEVDSERPPLASRCMLPSVNLEELVARLAFPRKIIVFGTYRDDRKFEQVWSKLCPVLEGGDMILRWGKEEGGNDRNIQFYNDSICRVLSAQNREVNLLEMVRLECDRTVVFEGENPEVFMLGGPREAYDQLEPYISPIASIGHVGNEAGCAHYAHMIQRVIENGITQSVAEGSHILSRAAGYEHQDIGRMIHKWNAGGGRLSSYLLRISSKIFYKRDKITNKGFVVEHITDSIDLSAVDTWVTLEATKLGIPAPTVNATLESRFLSVMKDERVEASNVLRAPEGSDTPSVMRDQISDDTGNAIYCACICLVAECFAIFQAASDMESWDVNIAECVRLWNSPGSFLESKLMEKINYSLVDDNTNYEEQHKDGDHEELKDNEVMETKNLMTVPGMAAELQDLHMAWRRIVALCFASAIPCPTLSSSLTYHDSYRTRKLPTSLIRAQRDFFDASGYSRYEEEGWFSTCWTNEHTKERKKKEKLAVDMAEEEGVEVQSPPKKKRKRKSTAPEKAPAQHALEAFEDDEAMI